MPLNIWIELITGIHLISNLEAKMKIATDIIKAIDTPEVRMKLALALKCSESTIRRIIKENEDNGRLTTPGAIMLISKETNKSFGEILDEAFI